jgi:hypothetical protein
MAAATNVREKGIREVDNRKEQSSYVSGIWSRKFYDTKDL